MGASNIYIPEFVMPKEACVTMNLELTCALPHEQELPQTWIEDVCTDIEALVVQKYESWKKGVGNAG